MCTGAIITFYKPIFNFASTGHELISLYRNDLKFAHLVRCFRALAFVPSEDVAYGFDVLVKSEIYDKRLNPFCAYFKVSICSKTNKLSKVDYFHKLCSFIANTYSNI